MCTHLTYATRCIQIRLCTAGSGYKSAACVSACINLVELTAFGNKVWDFILGFIMAIIPINLYLRGYWEGEEHMAVLLQIHNLCGVTERQYFVANRASTQ